MAVDSGLYDLSHRFLETFARMEFALKAVGLHNADASGNSNDAQPNWNDFAACIEGVFDSNHNADITAAYNYILTNPPKKQVIRNGVLEWEAAPAQGSDTAKLLIYIRRVRNNLFHGGKFNGHWFDPQRSNALLSHSLTILDYVRDIHPAVKLVHFE
jgi:hypothetical protein